MTKYEYDTMLVSSKNEGSFTKEFEKRIEDGFEVYNTQMVASQSALHIAYFLRREVLDDSRRTPAVLLRILKAQAERVAAAAINAPENDTYEKTLEKFYEMTTQILGLE